MPRVIAEYSDEDSFFEPPPHNGREVRETQYRAVVNGRKIHTPRPGSRNTIKPPQQGNKKR